MEDELPYVLTVTGLEQQSSGGVVGVPRQFGSIKAHRDDFLIFKEQWKKKPSRAASRNADCVKRTYAARSSSLPSFCIGLSASVMLGSFNLHAIALTRKEKIVAMATPRAKLSRAPTVRSTM